MRDRQRETENEKVKDREIFIEKEMIHDQIAITCLDEVMFDTE